MLHHGDDSGYVDCEQSWAALTGGDHRLAWDWKWIVEHADEYGGVCPDCLARKPVAVGEVVHDGDRLRPGMMVEWADGSDPDQATLPPEWRSGGCSEQWHKRVRRVGLRVVALPEEKAPAPETFEVGDRFHAVLPPGPAAPDLWQPGDCLELMERVTGSQWFFRMQNHRTSREVNWDPTYPLQDGKIRRLPRDKPICSDCHDVGCDGKHPGTTVAPGHLQSTSNVTKGQIMFDGQMGMVLPYLESPAYASADVKAGSGRAPAKEVSAPVSSCRPGCTPAEPCAMAECPGLLELPFRTCGESTCTHHECRWERAHGRGISADWPPQRETRVPVVAWGLGGVNRWNGRVPR